MSSNLIDIKNNIINKKDNLIIFNSIYRRFKQLLGILIIENIPKINNDFIIPIKSYQIKMMYIIQELKKNEINIDFNFEIIDNVFQNNQTISNLSEFILFLMQKDSVFLFFLELKRLFTYVNISSITIDKILNSLTVDTNSIKIDTEKIILMLNDKNLNIKVNGYLFNKGMERNYYNTLSLLISEFSLNDKINIYGLLDLLYYHIIEIDHTPDLFTNFKDHILLHDDKYFNTAIYKIMPIHKYFQSSNRSNLKFDANFMKQLYKYQKEIEYNIPLNASYFFNYAHIEETIEKEETKYILNKIFNDEIRINSYSSFLLLHNNKEDLWELFYHRIGIFIHQFGFGELYLEELEGESTEDLRKYKLYFTIKTKYSNYKMEFVYSSEDLKNQIYIEQIKTLYEYMKSIFMTYPLHSIMIGVNDILEYLILYDNFPSFRELQVPLIEDFTELIDGGIFSLKTLLENGILDYNELQDPILFEDLITSDNYLKETSRFREYFNATKKIRSDIGISFGEIELTKFTKTYKDRMELYLTSKRLKPITLNFNDFLNLIYFLIIEGYYYEITFWIQKYFQSKLFNINQVDIEDYNKFIGLFDSYRDSFFKDRLNKANINHCMIIIPTKINKKIFMDAGVYILIKSVSIKNDKGELEELLIISKLNRMRFNRKEIVIIEKKLKGTMYKQFEIIENIKNYITIPNININDYEKQYGILVRGLDHFKLNYFDAWHKFVNMEGDKFILKEENYDFVYELNQTYRSILKEQQINWSEYLNYPSGIIYQRYNKIDIDTWKDEW